jgi:hypothetical protein
MNDLTGIRYGADITAAAQAYGLDPRLLAGVAAQESGGPGASSGNNIVGDGGHGHGVFQIDDRSHAFARSAAAMDPAQNAKMAASILSNNLQQYGGNVKAALTAYNTGSPSGTGTSTTWSDGRTLGYADSVLRHVSELGGTTGALAAEAPYTSADVNALASLGAATPVATAGPAASMTLDPSLLASSASASSSSGSQFSPVVTWASMTSGQSGSGGAQAGSAADQGMADILDQVSVFGNDDSSDD